MMSTPKTAHRDLDHSQESIGRSEPRSKGHLVPLRTKAEVSAKLTLADAYVVDIPLQSANGVVKAADSAIPQLHTVNLQHLRRFVKPEFLPVHLRASFASSGGGLQTEDEQSIGSGDADTTVDWVHEAGKAIGSKVRERSQPQILYFLICAASTSTQEVVSTILSSTAPFSTTSRPHIRTIPIPLYPPTSEEQAQQWSHDYWPTVYKKHNPNGPHPSIVSRAEESIRRSVGKWMTLARQAGFEVANNTIGESIGVVVVDPSVTEGPVAVVAAGDARWHDDSTGLRKGNGNVMAHAVMRAIGLVARKRRLLLQPFNQPSHLPESDSGPNSKTFLDYPLTPLETTTIFRPSLKAGGYLCTGLEIYSTHEPCVMCSMAILHSRFDKVVFGKRMPRTGGLNAETEGLGYGLFWLEGLNWKLLAWEWVDEEEDEDEGMGLMVRKEIHV
ncbi:MAG: hypothetical protein Q9187_005099 [Circinaria calcarea]